MNNPFIGQVTLFAGNFAPRAYAFCEGQLLPISQNTALFSILGTTYGGDGRTTFALPDLRGRCAIQPGRGPGLSNYVLGERQGIETVNLSLLQLPSHSHMADSSSLALQIPASTGTGAATEPSTTDVFSSSAGIGAPIYGGTVNTHINMVAGGSMTVNNTGGSQSHENRRPFIAINYIIALEGIYPSRS